MNLTELKSEFQQDCISSGGSRGESVSWHLPASRVFPHSTTHGIIPHLKISNIEPSPSHAAVSLVLCLSFFFHFLLFLGPVIALGTHGQSTTISLF